MKGEPGESISAPNVILSTSKLTVNESTTASLLCSASGNPAPQVAWSRVNGTLPSKRTKVTSNGLMQIMVVRLEDAGKYKCVARNLLGRKEEVGGLVVQSKLHIILSNFVACGLLLSHLTKQCFPVRITSKLFFLTQEIQFKVL